MSIECAFFGTLGRDSERKTSKSGKAYVRLNLKVGEGDDGQWVSVMSFDPDAIAVADRLVKGARIQQRAAILPLRSVTFLGG